ncbi:MAG: FHA domain-containing protein [Gemmatimonadaceae bacterium]
MPHLTLLEKGSSKTHRLDGTDALVGRDPACGIFVEGDTAKTVSGKHARFFFDEPRWYVEDAGSRNGTFIGTRKLEPGSRHALSIGDVIGLGLSGTQLSVQEASGRALAATMLEPAPAPPPFVGGTVPMRRSEAIRAGIHDAGAGEEVRVTIRGVQSGVKSTGHCDRVTIGRALECIIRVEGDTATSVSRVHAEISVVNGKVSLRDGGSRHGTFLNGKKIDGATAAKAGDVLMLGPGGPTFTIDEVVIVPVSTTPSAPVQEPAAAKLSANPAPKPSSNRDAAGAFIAEHPTPALGRPAARPPSPTPPGNARPPGPATRLARASIGAVGRTALFRNVLEEISQTNAKRVRVAAWVGVVLFSVVTASIVIIAKQKLDRTDAELAQASVGFRQQAQEIEALRAAAISEKESAKASLDSAMSAAAPSAVLDSLRQALVDADRRSIGLEESLKRARSSLDVQLVSADSMRRVAEQDLIRLRQQMTNAEATGVSSRAVLDSLQRSLKAADDRVKEVSGQVRAIKGADFPRIAQLNQGAVGMVTVLAGRDAFDGSGFVISSSGYFLTNRHVVRPDSIISDSIYVTMSDHSFAYRADLVMVAPPNGPDVALLKIRNYKGPVVARIDWAGAHVIQGEGAALIGFPAGYDNAVDPTTKVVQSTMSAGIFAKVAPDRIQYSGLSVRGSSGSPLFNGSGEVVGIHFAGLAEGPGLGSAVPMARVLPLLPENVRAELGIAK